MVQFFTLLLKRLLRSNESISEGEILQVFGATIIFSLGFGMLGQNPFSLIAFWSVAWNTISLKGSGFVAEASTSLRACAIESLGLNPEITKLQYNLATAFANCGVVVATAVLLSNSRASAV